MLAMVAIMAAILDMLEPRLIVSAMLILRLSVNVLFPAHTHFNRLV